MVPQAALPERLTLDTAVPTLDALKRTLATATGPVVTVDTGALQTFDSSAIAVLLELRRDLLAQGKTLHITSWPQQLQSLVALYGVGELLQA